MYHLRITFVLLFLFSGKTEVVNWILEELNMGRQEKKTERAEHLAGLAEIEGALKEQERESEAKAAMQSTSTTSADDGVQRTDTEVVAERSGDGWVTP